MNYYAVDPYVESFAQDLLLAMQQTYQQNTNVRFYALIDGLFESLLTSADGTPIWQNDAISLYENTPYAELGASSPQLLPLTSNGIPNIEQIQALLDATNGIPMISFIASPLEAENLVETFVPFTELSSDHTSYLLRYADTRTLPEIDKALRKEQSAGWRSQITAWWLPSIYGTLSHLPNYHPMNEQALDNLTVDITEATFAELVEISEAGAIINGIFEQNSTLLSNQKGSFVSDKINQLKTVMRSFAINNFSDQVFFCSTALIAKPEFYLHPAFNQILTQKNWQAGQLNQALISIDDNHWQEVVL